MNPVQFTHKVLERIQDAVERATQALEELEQALDKGNQKAVGAAMYELHRALKEIKSQIGDQNATHQHHPEPDQ